MDNIHLLLDEIQALQLELDVITLSPDIEKAELVYQRTMVVVDEIRNHGVCKADAAMLNQLGTLAGAVESELLNYRSNVSANVVALESEGKASAGILTAILAALGAVLVYLAGKLFAMFFKADSVSSGSAAMVAAKPPTKLKLDDLAKVGKQLNINTLTNLVQYAAYLSISKDAIEDASKSNHELFEAIRKSWGYYEEGAFDSGEIVMMLRIDDVPLPYRKTLQQLAIPLETMNKVLPNNFKVPLTDTSVDTALFGDLATALGNLSRFANEADIKEIDGDKLYTIDKQSMQHMKRNADKFDEDVKAFSIDQSRWANKTQWMSNDDAGRRNDHVRRYNDIVVTPLRYVRNYQTGLIVRWYSSAIAVKAALDALAERLSKIERNIHREVKKLDGEDISGKSAYTALTENDDVRDRLSALEKIHSKLPTLKRDVDMDKFVKVLPLLKSSGYLK